MLDSPDKPQVFAWLLLAIVSNRSESVDTADAKTFLGVVKKSKVGVEYKNAPVAGTAARQDQLVQQTNQAIDKSVYGPLPNLAGYDLDPEMKDLSDEEMQKAAGGDGGGDGDGGDGNDDGDALGKLASRLC